MEGMRRTFVALALASLLYAGCSSFGSDSSSPADGGVGVPPEGGIVADASVDGDAATKRFCPVTGALFCSDFEAGNLIQEWLPTATPTRFLTLRQSSDPPGHVLRAQLDAASGMPGGKPGQAETLSKRFSRSLSVRYALDLRVDQQSADQSLEIASLKTTDSLSTTAFHIGIAGTDFFFGEYASGAEAGATKYNESAIGTIDAKWHRFEVEVFYTDIIEVAVRVDTATVIPRRQTTVRPIAEPTPDVDLTVGVSGIRKVTGPVGYAIDNVTFSAL